MFAELALKVQRGVILDAYQHAPLVAIGVLERTGATTPAHKYTNKQAQHNNNTYNMEAKLRGNTTNE